MKNGWQTKVQLSNSSDEVCQLSIFVPPLPEQQRIVGILDEAFDGIATAKANAETNLQNARALFESERQIVRGCTTVEKTVDQISII